VAAMLLLTLRGTPTIYMGEELGMHDGVIPPDRVRDPQGLNLGVERTRDVCRTPFQWSAAPYAGFSTVDPWLPVADGYETCNMAAQRDDPGSVLALYRQLLAYRRATPALNRGDYQPVDGVPADCFVYLREHDDQRRLVVLNFGEKAHTLNLSSVASRGAVALSTGLDRSGDVDLAHLSLAGNEGIIIEI
jgi:alpha-glucosidase